MSIYRSETGKFRLVVEYKKMDGSYSRVSKSFKTKKEAILYEPILRKKITGLAPNSIKFGAVAVDFLEYCKKSVRYTTYRNYEKVYRIHLKSYFENVEFGEIRNSDIDRWKNIIEGEISPRTHQKYSYQYLLNIWKVISLVFSRASLIFNVSNNALKQSGCFKRNPNLETSEKPLQFWVPNQFKKFIKQINSDIEVFKKENNKTSEISFEETKILIEICFCCGLRRGEANGLKITDYHKGKQPYLSIKRSVTDKVGLGRFLVTNPKNESSIRNVPVPEKLAKDLDDHIANYLKHEYGYNEEFFIVGGYNPQPSTSATTIKNKVEIEANLPHITIHDLRHSYVSMLLNKGVQLSTISKLAGHSSVEMTYKIYSHLYKETLSKIADLVDDLVK